MSQRHKLSAALKRHYNYHPERNPHSLLLRLHLDLPLLLSLSLLFVFSLIILTSASSENTSIVLSQAVHIALAIVLMLVIAQISPNVYQRWSLEFYLGSLLLLIAVLILGHINKGAQRWLSLGFFKFQPSELMKLAIPLCLSTYLAQHPLPPSTRRISLALLLCLIPAALTAKQPDLGTSILLVASGLTVIFLAGISWRYCLSVFCVSILSLPFAWYFMHGYQRERVLTFLNPERDPLGTGYHIIQSKIALGSGGLLGKGWLNGTQSHLHFLPEHATDFIFAVCGEEFGLLGAVLLLLLYALIIWRGLVITLNAPDTFTRLLAGSITLSFFLSLFINLGMVSGILPVVGVPLPLISYGGTSMLTLMASFGLLMSIQTHRKLLYRR
jgi:rod shape determining protein RodA